MASKSSSIKTALLPTIVALLLVAVIVVSEYQINIQAGVTRPIAVFSLQSEDETTEAQENLDSLVDEQILSAVENLREVILNTEFNEEVLVDFFKGSKLSEQQQPIAIAQLGKTFFTDKAFALCEQILLTISVEKRIQLGVQFTLAQSQSQQDKLTQALESYQQLISKETNNQSATINTALLLNKTKQYQQAVTIFTHAISISNSSRKAKAYAGLGSSLFELKQFENSVKAFKKSIEYRPQHAITWKKLALSLIFTKATPEMAKDAFEKSLSLAKEDYRLHFEYGRFLLSRLDFKNSTKHLLKARALSKNNADIRLQLALSYLERNKYKDARKHFSWIIKRKKLLDNKPLIEALISFSKKNYSPAVEQLQAIQVKESSQPLVDYYLGRAYSLTNQQASSVTGFKQLTNDTQWKYLSTFRLSRIYLAQKEIEKALTLTDKLLNESLNKESLLYQKSELLRLSGDHKNALTAILKAHELSPKSSRVRVRYAELLHLNKQSPIAIIQLEELLQRKPQYVRGHEALAKIHLELGDTNLAISHYTAAISSEPENTSLKYQLAEMLVADKVYLQANTLLADLLLQNSKHLNARLLLAKSHLLNSDYQSSLTEVDLALKLEPDNIIAINLKNSIMEKL